MGNAFLHREFFKKDNPSHLAFGFTLTWQFLVGSLENKDFFMVNSGTITTTRIDVKSTSSAAT